MSDETPENRDGPRADPKARARHDRAARLAAALKANIRRRKAQSRTQAKGGAGGGGVLDEEAGGEAEEQ